MDTNELMEYFGLNDTQGTGQKSEEDINSNVDKDNPEENQEEINDLGQDESGEEPSEEDQEGSEDDKKDEDKKDGRSAENAERRRQKEQKIKESQQRMIDEAVSRALKEQQEQFRTTMDAFVVSLGLKSPEGKPITTMEELREHRKNLERAELEKDLKAGKITPEHIRRIVADMPELRQEKPNEKSEEDPRVKAAIEADIKKISELDLSIKSIEDFVKMENHDRFYELVKRGNTFYDAFCLANMDKLVDMKAQAEARRKANLANSKEHLKSTSSRGQGAVPVPADVMAYYKELMPEATEAEIQKHYNSQLKLKK